MITIQTKPGFSYCLCAAARTTVSAVHEGATFELATHDGSDKQLYFVAFSASVLVDSEGDFFLQELE